MSVSIHGKNICLQPFKIKDTEEIATWLNDGEATRYMFYGRYPTTNEQVKELFKNYINDGKNIIFMMVDIKSGFKIGFAGIFDIDNVAKKAEPRMLIGKKDFWGQQYGMEGVALLTHYGFEVLGLNKLYGGVTRPDNKGPKKFYELLGYKIQGVQKNMAYRNSSYYDGIMIDMLCSEYRPKIIESYIKNFEIKIEKYE